MAFGERLQELRRARGMTQEDFAAQLKVSRQAVSKWESCRGYPELEKIIYICNRYGVTMNDLFCEEVPLGGQETPAAPERMESRTLKTALGDFVSNLSPANKWAGVGGLAAVTALVALCMLYLKGGGDSEMTALWIAAIVVFGVVEAVTAGLVSIWFVPGAVAGLIAAMAGAGLLIQLVLFLAVSAAALAATRPLVKKLSAGRAVPTNADRVHRQSHGDHRQRQRLRRRLCGRQDLDRPQRRRIGAPGGQPGGDPADGGCEAHCGSGAESA